MKWCVKLQFDEPSRRAEVDIYDVVGDPMLGTTAFAVLWQLRSFAADELFVRINSIGGVVSDGMDIYNLFREYPARRKVARISGVCASIATVIALGCDEVEMHENSQWMIHESRASLEEGGSMTAAELAKMSGILERTNQQLLAIYALKTGKSVEELAAACAAETWFTAAEAKAFGFVDRVIGAAKDEDVSLAARAWTPQVVGRLKRFPAPLLAVARAAQTPPRPRAEAVTEPPPAPESGAITEITEKDFDMKSTEFLKQIAPLTAALAQLQKDAEGLTERATAVAAMPSGTAEEIEAKSKDLEKLEKECKEMAKRAKGAEEELAKMSEAAAGYEEAKNRATAAEKELADLKKKLEAAKAEHEEPDGDEGEDGEDDDAEAKAALKAMNRLDLRQVARAAMELTGCKDPLKLVAAVAAAKSSAPRVDARAAHKARVEALSAEGKLTPAIKKLAMHWKGEQLDAYLEMTGGAKQGPLGEVATPDPKAAAVKQKITASTEVVLTAEEKKIAKQSGLSEERLLEEKRKSVLAQN